MFNSRFYGESVLDTPDGKQKRNVLILTPFVQTSEKEEDIDYDKALVVDLQSVEFDVKEQLENMILNREAESSPTFMEFAQKASLRNGSNVLRFLHENNAIKRVNVSDTYIVGHENNQIKKVSLAEVNSIIKADRDKAVNVDTTTQNSDTTVENAYSHPEVNEDNAELAMIERGSKSYTRDYGNPRTDLSESVADGVDPVADQAVNFGFDTQDTVPQPTVPVQGTQDVALGGTDSVGSESGGEVLNEVLERLDNVEKALKRKSQDSVVNRLIKRYDLTETEAVKALESAGERKRKREAKKAEKPKK